MTNKDDTGLLPCPFCGEKPLIRPQCPSIEGDAWTKITCDCRVEPSVTVYEDNTHFETAKHLWNTRAQPQNVEGENRPVTKSMDDLLFRLEYWGNFYYENGCKYAHEILLDYREELHKLVETALSDPKQHPSANVKEALDILPDIIYADKDEQGSFWVTEYGSPHAPQFHTKYIRADLLEIKNNHALKNMPEWNPENTTSGRITSWFIEYEDKIRAALTAQQPDVNQELLEALKSVLNHVEDEDAERISGQCTLCYSYRKMVRDVIARAEQKEQV